MPDDKVLGPGALVCYETWRDVGIVVGTRPDNRVIVFFPNAPNTTWMITPELVKKLVCLKERP